tara:strand:+ start:101 stop:547 length:447 start_codon:yes stop_codon:yes gene_type:complete
MRIRVTFLIIFLSILIIILGFNVFKKPVYEINGKAVMIRSIQDSKYKYSMEKIPIKGARIMAKKGKVLAFSTKVSIPIHEINSPKTFSLTNDQGIFKFKLVPGEYTFFIIIEDQAYLNSFDGKGNFSSIIIDSNISNIILIDDRGVLY